MKKRASCGVSYKVVFHVNMGGICLDLRMLTICIWGKGRMGDCVSFKDVHRMHVGRVD